MEEERSGGPLWALTARKGFRCRGADGQHRGMNGRTWRGKGPRWRDRCRVWKGGGLDIGCIGEPLRGRIEVLEGEERMRKETKNEKKRG